MNSSTTEALLAAPVQSPAERVGWYAWYVLGLLFLVAALNAVDRAIITVLQVPMKTELGLSDTQLGALTGLAFGLLYTTMAIPAALLADRTSRRAVLSAALAVWSFMTAACGVVTSFSGLFVARMGAGASEAAGNPTSHALISDYFPPKRRGTAMGIYGFGFSAGKLIGLAAAGWIVTDYGWRHAFMLFGVMGLVIAPIAFLTVRERKDSTRLGTAARLGTGSIGSRMAVVWRLRTFRYLCLGGMGKQLAMYTLLSWDVPFFVRVFKLPLGLAAGYVALMTGLSGGIGILLAGYLADKGGKTDERWYAWIPGLAAIGAVACGMVMVSTTNVALAVGAGVLTLGLIQAHLAPVVATVQSLVSVRMRALASAMLALISGTLGMSIGPLLTGRISDYLVREHGMNVESLRYAIGAMLLFALAGAFFYWLASRHIRHELAEARAAEPLVQHASSESL